ncbi:uncharacterized protein RAG0_05936 [Rhynchosporium agropyri]|uniref:Dienelactone hydrolase domain-containing protein n=1 Tax=Rhynchosporium agropyri TaxID=914238 RepID=A0A1E1KFB3_9HELO|nr:uncharacterized protein RAG0_05936 [Rhynchosporium agropyri]
MSYSVLQPHPLDGIQREGQPRGIYSAEGSYARYCVIPGSHVPDLGKFKEKNVGLIMFADETGFTHDNKMLADGFASAGYLTIMMSSALATPTNPLKTFDQNIEKAFNQFRSYRPQPVGSPKFRIVLAGYGRGIKMVLRLLARPDAPAYRFVAGYVASPLAVPAVTLSDYSAVTKPLTLAIAGFTDRGSTAGAMEREAIREALEQAYCAYQINLYSHVSDGFAWRRDLDSEPGKYAKKTTFVQALQWFKFHLFESS